MALKSHQCIWDGLCGEGFCGDGYSIPDFQVAGKLLDEKDINEIDKSNTKEKKDKQIYHVKDMKISNAHDNDSVVAFLYFALHLEFHVPRGWTFDQIQKRKSN